MYFFDVKKVGEIADDVLVVAESELVTIKKEADVRLDKWEKEIKIREQAAIEELKKSSIEKLKKLALEEVNKKKLMKLEIDSLHNKVKNNHIKKLPTIINPIKDKLLNVCIAVYSFAVIFIEKDFTIRSFICQGKNQQMV